MYKKIKIAHFITTSGLYGAEMWVLGLLRYLKKVDALLICPNTSDISLLKEANKLGIKTHLLKVKGNFVFFDFVNKLSELLKREKIDILHTHSYKSNLIGYFAAKKTGLKIISTPHGWSFNAGLKLRIYESIDRFFLRFFDLIVPLSKGLRNSLKHINKNKIKVINNFVDLDLIPKPKKGNLKLITFIGQLIERKRVQDLIFALKYVQDKKVKLQIIGNGSKKKKLISLTKKFVLDHRVKFFGFRKDRLELLNNSEILVLPSLLEGIPRVIMEAMAMKRIIIGTDIPGIRELIKNKKNGLLVPIKSPKKIAEAINWIWQNKKQTQKISKEARALIEKKFSAERAASEYSKIYKKIINL